VPGVYLSSIDFVKRPEALRPLEDIRWDLMVVDEAHAATLGSHRRDALHALACRSRRLLLLTATPHSGSEGQFEALCGLGAGPHASPIVLFHRRRSDVSLEALPLRSCVLAVRPTDRERRMHRRLEDYTSRVWTESTRRGDDRGALIATTLRKRALSSATALAASLRRRLDLLGVESGSRVQMRLPLDGPDPLAADDLPDVTLSGVGLDDEREEREVVGELAILAEEAAGSESKMRVLLRLVRRVRQPALIFSEYRDTAERIRTTLEREGYRALGLHGGMSAIARARTIAEFNGGGCLLVATDAASEGLNLQEACRLVVHFELPWTPMRLQQRTGRVNRIGQTRRVHEIALVARHTSEQLVLVPLVRRVTRAYGFADTGLVDQIGESRVASLVLGRTSLDEPRASRPSSIAITMNLRDEGVAEAERIDVLRRLDSSPTALTRAPRDAQTIVPVTHARGRSRSRSVTVVLALLLRDERELLFEQSLFALTFDVNGRPWERRPAALGSQVRRALEMLRAHISAAARAAIEQRLAQVEPLRLRVGEALGIREQEMRLVRQSTAQLLVQTGLFDRRAMRMLAGRVRAGEILDDEDGARGTGETLPAGGSGDFEIRAVLVGGRS
jgi:hypothetical protein